MATATASTSAAARSRPALPTSSENREPELQGRGEVVAGAGDDGVEGGGRLLDRGGVAGARELDEQGVDVVVVEDEAGELVDRGTGGRCGAGRPAGR